MTRFHRRTSPTLYRLAADRQYAACIERVNQVPSDVYWNDAYGNTALHVLCSQQHRKQSVALPARTRTAASHRESNNSSPTSSDSSSSSDSTTAPREDNATLFLRAILALVQHAPELVAQSNFATWTPLHLFVHNNVESTSVQRSHHRRRRHSHKTPSTVLVSMIRACPEAVSVRTKSGYQSRGKTAFYMACEADAEYAVLAEMLRINPALATEPYTNTMSSSYGNNSSNTYDSLCLLDTPLQLLWKNHVARCNRLSHRENQEQRLHLMEEAMLAKMTLLLQAMTLVQAPPCDPVVSRRSPSPPMITDSRQSAPLDSDKSTFALLNAACSVRCPRDFFTVLLHKQLEQGQHIKAETERLPLHCAVELAASSATIVRTPYAPVMVQKEESYFEFVLESLVAVYPESARRPDPWTGRWPLHVAVDTAALTWHKGGIRALAGSYMDAARLPDPTTGLVPFLAAAQHADASRQHLSTCYQLLLAAPEVLYALRDKGDGGSNS